MWSRLIQYFTLAPGDLLRDAVYRRLWSSILISSLGGQITMLALPLTAAVLLNASPTQMGLLQAMEILPFVLFSLPAGVLLDRVRKLPVYIAGESLLAVAVATVPLAAWLGWLGMGWLYVVGFVLGCVYTVAGSAAQIVLTQVVPRERLVEAHAKNALASSGAEVAGPGLAGALIKLLGAPLALAVDALLLLVSAARAQSWPAKPVRVIVQAPVGGPTDIVTRGASVVLSQTLGQPFVVENRAGANGIVGAEFGARGRARRDGSVPGHDPPHRRGPAPRPGLGGGPRVDPDRSRLPGLCR